jgi:hypothetical protein
LASNLRRSKRTFGQRFLRAEQQVNSAGRRPTPRRIGSRIVTSSNLAPGAVSTVVLADDVTTIINYAQATADGKNTIYYQASTPTGGTYAEDDIWFDTDDDNKLYRYNGTAWIGFQLGDNAIEELSADKLTAGTIDARDITVSNIDAGEITVGELNAVDIGAVDITGATITGGSLDIGSGTFEVDNLGNLTATSATITGGTITIGSGDTVFKVDSDGNMWLGDAVYADAEFKVSNAGALVATSATITGAISGASTITIGSGDTVFKVDSDGNMWLGDAVYADAEFKVSNAGALVATSATITGAINASSGSITGSLSAGDVRIGSDVRSAGHDGIVLVSTSWDNAWVRRDNTVSDPAYRNTVYFRAGTSTTYVQLDTGPGVSEINFNNGTFKVTDAGALTATSASVTGTINATGGTFSGDINVTGSLIAPTLKLGTSTPDSNVKITLGANFSSGISINGGYGSILVGKLLGPAGGEGNDYYGFSEHNFSVSNSGGNTETTMLLTNRDTPSYIDVRPLQPGAVYTNAQFQIKFAGTSRLGANSQALYISRQSTTSGIGFADIGFGGVGTYSSRRELKENIKDVLASESIERIRKLRPVDFTFKADAVNQELAPFNLRRGFIAEEMAEVSHEMAEWSWVDKDDAYQLAGFPSPETDEDGNIVRSSQQVIDEDYPLESAVPAYWNHDAVIADCVNAIKYILSVIDS